MSELNSTELLYLAAKPTTEQIAKAAHALGWPHPRARRWRRVNWTKPWRNYYAGTSTCPDWLALRALGMAVLVRPEGGELMPYAVWRVSPLGRECIKVRLLAIRGALRAGRAP